jgi:hypothetical protein
MGRKGMDHECVKKHFAEDLDELRNPVKMYDGHPKKNVMVVGVLLTSVTDHPERSDSTKTATHSGLFTYRFGWSTLLADPITTEKIMPCDSCFRQCMYKLLGLHLEDDDDAPCQVCADCN